MLCKLRCCWTACQQCKFTCESRLGAVVRRCMQARSLTGSELMPSGSVVVAGTGCSRPSCAAEQGRAAPLSSPHQSMHRKGQPGQDRLQAQGSASPEACRACEASCSDRTWPTTSTQVPSGWQVARRICCQPRRPLLPAWHRTSAPRSTDRPAACAASLSARHNSSMKVGSMFNGTDAGASNQEAGGRGKAGAGAVGVSMPAPQDSAKAVGGMFADHSPSCSMPGLHAASMVTCGTTRSKKHQCSFAT